MKIIEPVAITDANLTSSTVAEDDYAAWVSGTSYGLGAHVIKGHRRWESLQASNSNKDPVTSPTWWVDMGATNRWAMFDDNVGSVTSATSSMEVVLAPGAVSILGLLDTAAESVTMTMEVGATVVYTSTQSTQRGGEAISDWYLYFTAPIGRVSTVLFEDLPQYADAEITLTATSILPGGPVSIGTLAVGRVLEIGTVESGATAGINDFSKKETDGFGQTRIVERSWAKRIGVRLKLSNDSVDLVYSTLAKLRATPIVWIASRRFDCLVAYGFYKSFEIDVQYGDVSYCTLAVEGLI